ncbi:MAG: fluoride efflux transporter CrcB [Treponema sp.]|jgi:CrcB protein|nr:fluoride efflux transporter CrcB [Treponema sp.]
MIINCLVVGAGGAIGAVMRYLFCLLPLRPQNGFPVTTLAVNLSGAFCLGLIVALAGRNVDFNPRLLLFLKIGLCGGFTTFSTFSTETMSLLQEGKIIVAVSYMALSVVLCVSAVAAAQAIV